MDCAARLEYHLGARLELLIGQNRFVWFSDESAPLAGYVLDEQDESRNIGDVLNLNAALNNVIGPRGPYSSAEGAFQVTQKTNQSYSDLRSAIQSTFADTQEQDISVFFIATHGQETADGDLRTSIGHTGICPSAHWLHG